MEHPVLIFLAILAICLSLGGIGSGIYVAVQKNKYKDKPKDMPSVVPTVVLIMVVSFFLALVIFAIAFTITRSPPAPEEHKCPNIVCPPCKECEKAIFTETDYRDMVTAQHVLQDIGRKVDQVPRDIKVTADCQKGPGGVCVDPFKQVVMMGDYSTHALKQIESWSASELARRQAAAAQGISQGLPPGTPMVRPRPTIRPAAKMAKRTSAPV
jgi:hypothetical protein